MMVKLPKYRVLFVCIGNACRSPMAESIALKIAPDIMEVSSAGIAPLGRVAEATRVILAKRGYDGESLESKAIRPEVWDAADIVVNLTGTERRSAFFDSEKVEDWPVPDPYGSAEAAYEAALNDIEARVKELAAWLRQKRNSEFQTGQARR